MKAYFNNKVFISYSKLHYQDCFNWLLVSKLIPLVRSNFANSVLKLNIFQKKINILIFH